MTGGNNSFLQLVTVLFIFVLVLGITAATTKWIANFQKQQNTNCNVEVVETTRIGNNKYLQIVRVGDTYMAIAVCKDTVTLLGEIPKDQIKDSGDAANKTGFRETLDKMIKKSEHSSKPKE